MGNITARQLGYNFDESSENIHNNNTDFNSFKYSIINFIKQNNYIPPNGVTFKANQQFCLENKKNNEVLVMSLRQTNPTDITQIILPNEVNGFANKMALKVFEQLDNTFYPILYYMHICLDELEAGSENFSIEFSCEYNFGKETFEPVAELSIKLVFNSQEPKKSLYNNRVFANLGNILLSHFSTKKTVPKVSTIHNGSCIYHYTMDFDFSVFAFLKRQEINALETALYQYYEVEESSFIKSVDSWVRKLQTLNQRKGDISKYSNTYFEVLEAEERKLKECVDQSRFYHNNPRNLAYLKKPLLNSIKTYSNKPLDLF